MIFLNYDGELITFYSEANVITAEIYSINTILVLMILGARIVFQYLNQCFGLVVGHESADSLGIHYLGHCLAN